MKRPVFLIIWLALLFLGQAYGLYSYTLGAGNLMKTLPNAQTSLWPLYAGINLINVFAIIMLWMWKKIGFYIMIGTAVIGVFLSLMTSGVGGVTGGIFSIASAVIGILILYLAMKPVWQNFK